MLIIQTWRVYWRFSKNPRLSPVVKLFSGNSRGKSEYLGRRPKVDRKIVGKVDATDAICTNVNAKRRNGTNCQNLHTEKKNTKNNCKFYNNLLNLKRRVTRVENWTAQFSQFRPQFSDQLHSVRRVISAKNLYRHVKRTCIIKNEINSRGISHPHFFLVHHNNGNQSKNFHIYARSWTTIVI